MIARPCTYKTRRMAGIKTISSAIMISPKLKFFNLNIYKFDRTSEVAKASQRAIKIKQCIGYNNHLFKLFFSSQDAKHSNNISCF